MGNALFRKLFQSVLMNEEAGAEAAGGGGDVPAGEPAAVTQPGSEAPAQGAEQPASAQEKTDQQKTEAELAAEKEAAEKAEKDKKPEGAPEKYEFKAGEGTELDAAALKDFEPVAREMGLTNEQAQKLVDVYPKILAGVQQRQTDAWQKATEQWAEDVKADKEIGGDKLTASISSAQRALETFGTPELKEYLNTTGLGNHPELVKAFVKIGKSMSEDSMITGKESGERSAAEVLYGKN